MLNGEARFDVGVENSGAFTYAVYNFAGQKVWKHTGGRDSYGLIRVSWEKSGNGTVGAGTYFVNLEQGNRKLLKRVVLP